MKKKSFTVGVDLVSATKKKEKKSKERKKEIQKADFETVVPFNWYNVVDQGIGLLHVLKIKMLNARHVAFSQNQYS